MNDSSVISRHTTCSFGTPQCQSPRQPKHRGIRFCCWRRFSRGNLQARSPRFSNKAPSRRWMGDPKTLGSWLNIGEVSQAIPLHFLFQCEINKATLSKDTKTIKAKRIPAIPVAVACLIPLLEEHFHQLCHTLSSPSLLAGSAWENSALFSPTTKLATGNLKSCCSYIRQSF